MIDYVTTPSQTNASARVYSPDGRGFTIDAVENPPDFAALIDTVEESLLDAVNGDSKLPLKDVALNLINTARLELLSELLLKLIVIFKDSDNIRLDIDCLISAAGLPLTEKSDSALSAEHNVSRQSYSARKKALMKRLGLAPILHAKSQTSVDNYAQTNRKNSTFNN